MDVRYRLDSAFREGVKSFLLVAEKNRNHKSFMCCPCVICVNTKNYSNKGTIHLHLLKKGFMPHYNVWTKHGEKGVMMEDDDEEDNDDYYRSMLDDTAMEDNEEGGEEEAADEQLMILVGPFLMQRETAARIKRGCSLKRC